MKDSLINGNSFSVQMKNDSLIINGTLQTKETLDKYRSLLSGNPELNIEMHIQENS